MLFLWLVDCRSILVIIGAVSVRYLLPQTPTLQVWGEDLRERTKNDIEWHESIQHCWFSFWQDRCFTRSIRWRMPKEFELTFTRTLKLALLAVQWCGNVIITKQHTASGKESMCFHNGGHPELGDRMFHNYPFINNAQHFYENGIVLFGKDEMKQNRFHNFCQCMQSNVSSCCPCLFCSFRDTMECQQKQTVHKQWTCTCNCTDHWIKSAWKQNNHHLGFMPQESHPPQNKVHQRSHVCISHFKKDHVLFEEGIKCLEQVQWEFEDSSLTDAWKLLEQHSCHLGCISDMGCSQSMKTVMEFHLTFEHESMMHSSAFKTAPCWQCTICTFCNCLPWGFAHPDSSFFVFFATFEIEFTSSPSYCFFEQLDGGDFQLKGPVVQCFDRPTLCNNQSFWGHSAGKQKCHICSHV